MASTCRISFISIVILFLLFINQSTISCSARIRLMEGRVLADEKQHGLLTLDEIKKADRDARLDFAETIEAETNFFEDDSRPLSRMELINSRF
ncbi:unnamed protein product [Microthlaspi erraticum]|uniref:Uncharacterized protein n=1 Tax=Microthlaspi erraticum TaxID=1685480 RepID=A0A6D2JJK1_9BRAS|nr:unnamed protein product [Microthlaspi erraticum]